MHAMDTTHNSLHLTSQQIGLLGQRMFDHTTEPQYTTTTTTTTTTGIHQQNKMHANTQTPTHTIQLKQKGRSTTTNNSNKSIMCVSNNHHEEPKPNDAYPLPFDMNSVNLDASEPLSSCSTSSSSSSGSTLQSWIPTEDEADSQHHGNATENDPSDTDSQDTSRPRHTSRVRFSHHVSVYEILSRQDMMENNEIEKLWYTDKEEDSIIRRARSMVRRSQFRNKGQNDEALRGLEPFTRQGSRQAAYSIEQAYRAVRETQGRGGSSERIARLYHRKTERCVELAIQRAVADHEAAKE